MTTSSVARGRRWALGRVGGTALGACAWIACAALVACGSSDGGAQAGAAPPPDTNASDGGDAGPLVGDPLGNLAVSAPKDVTIAHGSTATVTVTITRTAPFEGPVSVALTGAPPGLAVGAVTVPPGETTAELSVVAAKELAQGPLSGVKVQAASLDGHLVATAPFTGFVRGLPGELDTTFGTNGSVAMGTDYTEIAMLPDGRFFAASYFSSVVKAFSPDGAVASTFDSGLAPGATSTRAIAFAGGHLYVAGVGASGGQTGFLVRRYDDKGTLDATFGSGGTLVWPHGGNLAVHGLAFAADGRGVVLGSVGNADYWVGFINAAGAKDTTVNASAAVEDATPAQAFAALHLGAQVIVAGDGQAMRLSASTGALDTSFATNGAATASGVQLISVARDSKGRFVLGGYGTNTVVIRLTPTGQYDTTFDMTGRIDGTGKSYGRAGSAAVQADDAIVQSQQLEVGAHFQCAIARYTPAGAPDTGFGTGGMTTLPFDDCYPGQVALQPDGRVVMGGSYVARFWP